MRTKFFSLIALVVMLSSCASQTAYDPATDMRTLITQADWKTHDKKDCSVKMVEAQATTSVDYANENHGVAMKLPYSPAWGSEQFKIPPFEDLENRAVLFGALGDGLEGCGWYRNYALIYTPAQSSDAVVKELTEAYKGEFQLTPEKAKIGDYEIVKYQVSGVCADHGYIVVTPSVNLKLSSICTLSDDDTKVFEDIIESLTLSKSEKP